MNDTDDSDDDFLAASQVSFYGPNGWTSQNGASTSQRSQNQGTSRKSQNHGASTSQAQKQASTKRSKNNGDSATQNRETASQRPENHGTSNQVPQNPDSNSDRQRQLELLTQGVKLLQDQIVALAQSDQGKDKKEDKKKKPKEIHECQLCHKVYVSTVTLFRHYKAIHNEFNPEKFGYTVNGSIINIDDSMSQDHCCGTCGYKSADKNAFDIHMAAVHSKDVKELCKVCGYKARSKNDLDDHSRIHVNNDSGNSNNVVETIKNIMHKCEDCSCYFDDNSKFDEHMKKFHRFEVLCKICNKNFSFKDFENHVKDNHPIHPNVIVENNVRTQKGRTVIFKCNKCTEKFASKQEAWRHTKMHKKELRRRVVYTNNEETLSVSDIIYICEVCDIATDSYDVVVEHSQKHIKNPDEQFLTNSCGICSLKFEPICYDKHIDIHYTKKGVNKESFKYLKYKYHLLLTDDWLKFFNMADDVVNAIVSKSIYAYTRSVKMRVVSGKSNTITLYQCRQCDNFVDPSAVRSHAVDFDTCVRIPTSFGCNVCERSFNTEFARDNHEAVHADMNGNDCFRIVMFNDERHREFNYVLDNTVFRSQVEATNTNENNATEKVIYKCFACSLCFILEVSANNHIKTCPSHKNKATCRICSNWFNIHELPDHYYDHHFSGKIRLNIKDIVPDVILVSDDEDDNKNIKTKQSYNVDSILDDDKENKPQTSQTENVTQTNESSEETNIQPNLLVATETAKDNVPMDEDSQDVYNQSTNDGNSDHSDIEVSHDDSRSTIINGECYNVVNIGDVAGTNEIKCVETNLLLNPYYTRNRSERIVDADERNEDLGAEIETTTQKIALGEVRVKQENSWYIEEDTNMNWKHVKQIKESNVTSTDTIIDLSAMLTDDEDEGIQPNPVNESTDINANKNYYTCNSALPSTDGAYSLENIITDDIARNLRNLQNATMSNSNASNVVEERANNVLANENSTYTAVLSRRTHVNTDNLKDEMIKMKHSLNESGIDDSENSEIDEIQRHDDSTMRRFRNVINNADVETRFMVNNLEIQLSDQKVIVKPNCSIC
ncbi:uncharacterized protein [Choristoneura fumiferana]|uniref:uncharacterized protein n=1 Tax=Choristoneura fumiferana TaxID=7141 RepID=UPI003D15D7EE